MSYLLFDIGGTNTRVALSDDLTSFGNVKKFRTPSSYKEGIDLILAAAKELGGGKSLTAAGGGIRGIVDHEKTKVISDQLLTEWVDQPLVLDLAKKLKTDVHIENDTAVVGLGEYHFGAGHDVEIMVYHTVSTGVGGVKIEQGRIDDAMLGLEPGHQILDIDRTVLGDDIDPTLENLVSGSALEKRTGTKPADIPQDDVIWDELAGYLAQGLKNTVLYWSPEVIVLGGSMILGNPRITLEAIRKHTVEELDGFVPCPLIVDAKLGDEGGLYGAMVLLQQRLEHD